MGLIISSCPEFVVKVDVGIVAENKKESIDDRIRFHSSNSLELLLFGGYTGRTLATGLRIFPTGLSVGVVLDERRRGLLKLGDVVIVTSCAACGI